MTLPPSLAMETLHTLNTLAEGGHTSPFISDDTMDDVQEHNTTFTTVSVSSTYCKLTWMMSRKDVNCENTTALSPPDCRSS